jgi:hypothetical protein
MTDTIPAPAHSAPRGAGLYLGRVLRAWNTSEAVKHAHRVRLAKISHVCLCARAIDGFSADPAVLAACAAVYREIAGVSVSLYQFPGSQALRDVQVLVDESLRTIEAVHPAHLVPDCERAFRGTTGVLRAWIRGVRERVDVSIGATTLGTPHGIRDFPWAELVDADWLGWQEYDTAGNRTRSRAGMAELEQLMGGHDRVVPHCATYERTAVTTAAEGMDGALRLKGDLERACLDDRGACDVPGVWLWSDASLDDDECGVVADFVQRAGWR